MRFHTALLCGAALTIAPAGALAADKVLTGAAPEWVSPADLDAATVAGGPNELIADFQHRTAES